MDWFGGQIADLCPTQRCCVGNSAAGRSLRSIIADVTHRGVCGSIEQMTSDGIAALNLTEVAGRVGLALPSLPIRNDGFSVG